jgi:type III restriction enzyme
MRCPEKRGRTPAKWRQWKDLHSQKSNLIGTQCAKLQELSGGQFRARIKSLGATQPIKNALEEAFTGKNIRKVDEKIDALVSLVADNDYPFDKWSDVIGEFEILIGAKESNIVPSTPLLESAGLTRENRESLRDALTKEKILDLRLVVLEDLPIFEFRTGMNTYISFDNASAGQQATVLLKILLNQEGPPLLIDQPEEDLDNEIIHEIATNLWDTKSKRQLIFVSHNANIVVNGDAELVLVFDHVNPDDPSQGHITHQGAIDIAEIRECIKKVMEGGAEAFELRRQKYGF